MGKYMRKAKAAGEVALMEVSQPSLGVRTRARTLALKRLQKAPAAAAASSGSESYLQLRSRRLEKPPILVSSHSKKQKQTPKGIFAPNPNPSSNSRTRPRLRVSPVNSGSAGSASLDCSERDEGDMEAHKMGDKEAESLENNSIDEGGIEASFGENVLEFEGRERTTRESTPCSLIRDPESIRTPGSTTRPTCSNKANRRVQHSVRGDIPTAQEVDEFFAGAERQQQREFIEKYNFDPVNDKPLPGCYQWVKLDP